jgi:D-lactate dehydrogenase
VILNPGVLINEDPQIHLANLKPMPASHELIDQCIECGFCEPACPSKDLTLTPRQRIVIYRRLHELETKEDFGSEYRHLAKAFKYQGDATCATDGLCALNCPVDINTGTLVKDLRLKTTGHSAEVWPGSLAAIWQGLPHFSGSFSMWDTQSKESWAAECWFRQPACFTA